jgi:hypothetical protein
MSISRETIIASVCGFVAIPVAAVCTAMAIIHNAQNWFGVGAAALGIDTIMCVFLDYFFPPKIGQKIMAPDQTARRIAGIIGVASGVFWMLGSWPGLI